MDLTWLELAGKLSLLLFPALVVALLVAGARRVRSRARTERRDTATALPVPRPASARTFGALGRFVSEYVGNVAPEEAQAAGGGAGSDDRHGNGGTRPLLDQIIGEMDRRHVPPFERETFLEDLRRAIRSEEQLRALGVATGEAERRFLETQRWVLAERFHSIVEDPPPEIVARIKSGFRPAPDSDW